MTETHRLHYTAFDILCLQPIIAIDRLKKVWPAKEWAVNVTVEDLAAVAADVLHRKTVSPSFG